eukprot:jgi/Botrbrau1/14739/Bobra.0108s0083.2
MSDGDSHSERFAALIENRAREVGVALLNVRESKLDLIQFIESSRSYSVTLSLLRSFEPDFVAVVSTPSPVNQACNEFKLILKPRRAFDDTNGHAITEQYSGGSTPTLAAPLLKTFYLAVGAAGALLETVEEDLPLRITPGSLFVACKGQDDFLQIDCATAQALELTVSQNLAAYSCKKPKSTLLGWLDHTRTKCGARLLRANILQPLTHVETLQLRYEALAELIGDDNLNCEVTSLLERLPKHLDYVCGKLAIKPAGVNSIAKGISSSVQAAILLYEVLSCLPPLASCLEQSKSVLLRAASANLSHPSFAQMLEVMTTVLDDDVHAHHGAFMNQVQQCFAVKSGQDGLLDLARETFQRLSEEIYSLLPVYRENFDLPTLQLSFTARREFFFLAPRPGYKARDGSINGDLPRQFLHLEQKPKGKQVACTTLELNALNARLKDATNDCMQLTYQVLERLLSHLRQNLPFLYKLVDNIALLDVLCAYRVAVTESNGEYVQPTCMPQGPIAIVGGHHPLIENSLDGRQYQPNDTYLAECSTCQVIIGPNMRRLLTCFSMQLMKALFLLMNSGERLQQLMEWELLGQLLSISLDVVSTLCLQRIFQSWQSCQFYTRTAKCGTLM